MKHASPLDAFNWQPQPKAQSIINDLSARVRERCPFAADFAARLLAETGTRLNDWLDHLVAPRDAGLKERLLDAGFRLDRGSDWGDTYVCDLGMFPAVILRDDDRTFAAVKVESVTDFLAAHNLPHHDRIEGEPLAQLRMAPAFTGDRAELWVVERHGTRAFEAFDNDPEDRIAARAHAEAFRVRRRAHSDDALAFADLNRLVDDAIRDIGRDWTCDIFFAAEREYWMRRNRAAQVQFARQQRHGLGWANHDHHTYRSSRARFKDLIALWEKLGFVARERFYAGAEAGWGAQVMEQPVTGIITFNDVDMTPEELMGDFSHQGLPDDATELGTVGLWCALHGEAVLDAGMHHLEAQFDWHALVSQLESTANIKTMAPFTTFSYLRQAFTEGEHWPVSEERIDRLLARGLINRHQADQFRREGAVGSHLENLERNDGFKGFNQKGVSDIIARTDPRRKPDFIGA